MAGPGGKGEIVYSDGCRVQVRPGSVVVVAPVSPCAQGQAATGDALPMALGALAAAGGVVGIAAIASAALRNNNPASP
jgi:hypothetical protein